LILITPRRLNPAPRVERLLYAGHAPAQGAGSVGQTFDEQHSPSEAPSPLIAPPPETQPENETPPIVTPLPQGQPPQQRPRPQPNP